jgi:hypothetical protein
MSMNSYYRRAVLLITATIGAFVGIWAAAFPVAFYQSFPGFGLIWIAIDGPFNEHLIRDVGALYLGLAAATLAACVARDGAATRVVGIAWTTFGALHLRYHLAHLAGLAPIDVLGNVVSLGGSLLLGLALLVPGRRERAAQSTTPRGDVTDKGKEHAR